MIGRGVFGNPWLFAQCPGSSGGPRDPSHAAAGGALRHGGAPVPALRRQQGEKIACLEARRHYAWYLKGVPHAGYYKEQIVKITTLEDVYRVTKGIKRDLC